MSLADVPVLGLLIVWPLLAAVTVAFAPRHARSIALGAAGVELLAALAAIGAFDPTLAGPQLVERVVWVPALGVEWHVGLDATGALFVPLTAALGLVALLADGRARPAAHFALLLVFEAALVGVYTALDAVLFYAFWEATLGPLLLLGLVADAHGAPDAGRSAGRATTALLIGGAALLAGLLVLVVGAGTADLGALAAAPPSIGAQRVALVLIGLGLATKAPVWPLHGWMPRLVAAGPLGVGVLVLGLKMGVWGLLRVAAPLCPDAFAEASGALMALGLGSALWAGLVALRQRDLRRLVAWISVGHAGLVVAGIASGAADAIDGALFDLLVVGAVSPALLLIADRVERQVGSGDLAAVAGLGRTSPALAAALVFFALAALGLPLTGGFVGELLIFTGLGARHPVALAAALVTVPLFAIAVGRVLAAVVGGRPTPRVEAAPPTLARLDTRLLAALALATVLAGVLPGPVLGRLRAPRDLPTAAAALSSSSPVMGSHP